VSPAGVSAGFDDPNLIGYAGLVPAMRLAEQAGLYRLADDLVHCSSPQIPVSIENGWPGAGWQDWCWPSCRGVALQSPHRMIVCVVSGMSVTISGRRRPCSSPQIPVPNKMDSLAEGCVLWDRLSSSVGNLRRIIGGRPRIW